MPSFVEDLWNSIFTPGPTPTLLVATNVSFAALQLVLFALLLATYSVHFLVLSFLCGSLWWAINWFAREVRAAQAAQAASEQNKSETKTRSPESTKPPGAIDTTESETETESLSRSKVSSMSMAGSRSAAAPAAASAAPRSTAASSVDLHPSTTGSEDVRRRLSSSMVAGDTSSGYGSTDSEWEKVDDTKGV